jgi:cytochrome P450
MTERPTVDFDHHSQLYATEGPSIYAAMRERCPVAWSDSYGGFWVLSRYDDVAEVARDDMTFSSRHDIPPDGDTYTGINIPPTPNRATPIEMDPPRYAAFRRFLNPAFAPAAIEKLQPRMYEYADWCLDQVIESGSIDFVVDLANPVPAMATLAFLGLDLADWYAFSWPFHDIVACPPGTDGWNRAVEGTQEAVTAVGAAVAERRQRPRNDLLTHFTEIEVEGELLSDEVILEVCTLILGGGVDTTTALLGHALHHLGLDREARARISEDRSLVPLYCEELLRMYTPVQALARTATRDVAVGGQQIAAGERVMLCWAAANRDPATFDQPDDLVIDRFPNRHAAFGLGAHRCLGSNFARSEFAAMLNRVLDRLPDYELADGAERYESVGAVNGWHRLPARFTPGAVVGAPVPRAG